MSDPTGRFRIEELARGTYLVTVSLAGFRTQTTTVQVDSSAGPEMIVKLTTGILSEVLWVVPKPADAYRLAAAIGHVRIDGTRRYGPCGDAHVVTSHHDASVLRALKGQLPATIQLDQEAAGRCSERGRWYEGVERPYRAGEEYVVFLTERPDGFARLAGPSLAFPVRGQLVRLEGFAGVQGSISLNELGELLDGLSRNAAPDGRELASVWRANRAMARRVLMAVSAAAVGCTSCTPGVRDVLHDRRLLPGGGRCDHVSPQPAALAEAKVGLNAAHEADSSERA